MNKSEQFPIIAKTMAELEDVLAEELLSLGAENVEIGTRMVSFTGDKALLYKANIHCRTALHILKPIFQFTARDADEVYQSLKSVDWDQYLTLDQTFSIDAVVNSHIFTHSMFVAYRTKDAIADWFTEKYGKRPSVSVTNPDLVFNIHVSHNKCTLSLDSSGESLHKRGYRVAQTEAPLNEVLAAGMILKSGWRGESTFIDPMCGSGTLLIEAAMIALGIPPGIHRQHFAFEKWSDFDEELFSEIYNDDSGARDFQFRIIGSDISPKAIAVAEKNIKNAGLKKYIDLSVKPIQQYSEAPQPPGVLMTNPPYGERIKVDDIEALYATIGERLKHVFVGYDAYILSYRKELFDKIGLKPTKRFFLFNGQLECEMREFEIFSGKREEHDRDERPENAIRRERRGRKSVDVPRRKPYEDFKGKDFSSNRGKRFSAKNEDRPHKSVNGDKNRDRGDNPSFERKPFKRRERLSEDEQGKSEFRPKRDFKPARKFNEKSSSNTRFEKKERRGTSEKKTFRSDRKFGPSSPKKNKE
jgi:putative N6-adenine-specific DNA methylase